jgi:hypothetical protein
LLFIFPLSFVPLSQTHIPPIHHSKKKT